MEDEVKKVLRHLKKNSHIHFKIAHQKGVGGHKSSDLFGAFLFLECEDNKDKLNKTELQSGKAI